MQISITFLKLSIHSSILINNQILIHLIIIIFITKKATLGIHKLINTKKIKNLQTIVNL